MEYWSNLHEIRSVGLCRKCLSGFCGSFVSGFSGENVSAVSVEPLSAVSAVSFLSTLAAERLDRWSDGQTFGYLDGRTDGRTVGQSDRWSDGRTVRRSDERSVGRTVARSVIHVRRVRTSRNSIFFEFRSNASYNMHIYAQCQS